jgi:hypothetical protein
MGIEGMPRSMISSGATNVNGMGVIRPEVGGAMGVNGNMHHIIAGMNKFQPLPPELLKNVLIN